MLAVTPRTNALITTDILRWKYYSQLKLSAKVIYAIWIKLVKQYEKKWFENRAKPIGCYAIQLIYALNELIRIHCFFFFKKFSLHV